MFTFEIKLTLSKDYRELDWLKRFPWNRLSPKLLPNPVHTAPAAAGENLRFSLTKPLRGFARQASLDAAAGAELALVRVYNSEESVRFF
jgi:hypothetical protein